MTASSTTTALVAQGTERPRPKRRVGGSIPSEGTIAIPPKKRSPRGGVVDSRSGILRDRAHAYLDALWRLGRDKRIPMMNRTGAYLWMRERMNLSLGEAHIANFDSGMCRRLMALVLEDFPTLDVCDPVFGRRYPLLGGEEEAVRLAGAAVRSARASGEPRAA